MDGWAIKSVHGVEGGDKIHKCGGGEAIKKCLGVRGSVFRCNSKKKTPPATFHLGCILHTILTLKNIIQKKYISKTSLFPPKPNTKKTPPSPHPHNTNKKTRPPHLNLKKIAPSPPPHPSSFKKKTGVPHSKFPNSSRYWKFTRRKGEF